MRWPNTGPLHLASLSPCAVLSIHPNEPFGAGAEPSLTSRHDWVHSRVQRAGSGTNNVNPSSSMRSQRSKVGVNVSNDGWGTNGICAGRGTHPVVRTSKVRGLSRKVAGVAVSGKVSAASVGSLS